MEASFGEKYLISRASVMKRIAYIEEVRPTATTPRPAGGPWRRQPALTRPRDRGASGPACYNSDMTAKPLKEVMQRVETWPEEAQEQLAELALEIDAELARGDYRATEEELRTIDEALGEIDRGEVASEEEVAAVFAKFRPT